MSPSRLSLAILLATVFVSPALAAGPVSAGNSTVAASPNTVPADGSTAATITVTLEDASGNPVAGKAVTLASSRGAVDTISAASGASSAAGTVTFAVKSGTPGTAVLSAADATDSLTITQTAPVFVYDLDAKGPQASPIPVVFNQTATTDNLIALPAASAEYSSNLTLYQDGPSNYPKHFWISNWGNNVNDYFKWNVSLAAGSVYHVYAKLSANAVLPLQLSIAGTSTALNFNTRNIGWDKLDCGTISIPSGISQLVLRKNSSDTSQAISIKSIELIRQSDLPAYQQRVANFRADTTWLSQSKYGLMTQFGAWGYPPSGPQASLQDMANGFDVSKFVNLVTATGCKYVIFSMTWYTYQMLAPIQSVDNIVPGDTNLTSTRDVIGELSTALHAAGIRFMLYYHCGSDSQSPGGYDTTPWWQAQQFPEPAYTEQGLADRTVFLNNWINVITEIGNRYGTNLDGWFIDDALVYYPAPFERLGQAAKAGNPNRLVCYNPWIIPEYTDFQEVFMGEQSQGQSQFGSAPVGGNGIFTDGPQAGLLQHAMFTLEQDWGIHEANQPITTQMSPSQVVGWAKDASSRNVPLSINMMLWSDQTYSASSYNVLLSVKSAIYGGNSAAVSSSNLVVNGAFATPAVAAGGDNALGAGSTGVTGWTVDASPSDGVQLGSEDVFGTDNGSQDLQLTGGSAYSVGGGISQTIPTTPGATYTIIVDVASRQPNAVAGNFNFGGRNHALNASSSIFNTLTWTEIATGHSTVIDITGSPTSASSQLLIANVSVTPSAPQSAVPLTNNSFENPAVNDGSYETASTPGWSFSTGGNAAFALINPGGTGSGQPWPSTNPTGLDGLNFAQIFINGPGGNGIVYQDTGIPYQAGMTYTLTAGFGLATSQTLASGATMFLGNSSLAPISSSLGIVAGNLSSGAFVDQALSYSATGNEAAGNGAAGTPGDVIIAFSASAPASGSYLDFDNVRLNAVPTSFTGYQQQYFSASQLSNPSVSGASADANGDGVSNLMAAALGINPWTNAASSLPVLGTSGGHLTLTFTRLKLPTAWTMTAEVSSDLVNWQSGPTYTTQTSVTSVSANIEQATFQDNTLMTGNSPRFMRLKVTSP